MQKKYNNKLKDVRQVPKTQEYLANPLYWDVVYSYMQVNSEWDGVAGHSRIFPKEKAVQTKMGRDLGLARQTIARHLKDLEDGRSGQEGLHLIKKLDTGDYELFVLDPEIATLIQKETLRMLVSACNDKTISTYIYLFGRWMAVSKKEYQITYGEIKAKLGIGGTTKSNNYIIKDILTILEKIGLITMQTRSELSTDGGYKTCYYITSMKDTI